MGAVYLKTMQCLMGADCRVEWVVLETTRVPIRGSLIQLRVGLGRSGSSRSIKHRMGKLVAEKRIRAVEILAAGDGRELKVIVDL